jgi:hypothetical protein
MLKHEAVTQTEALIAETQSEAPGAVTQNYHTVRSRRG